MSKRIRKNLGEDVQVPSRVNADYVHSLEESNRTLRRLLNQERRANEELQAVMNELLEELQTVTQAAERSTAIVNRAQRLIQFPKPPGPAPHVSPRTQRDESPRVGPTPAPSGRASTSEQPGVKRKSADDLGETEPVKRGRWFTPSAMTIAEDRARCSPPQRNGNSSMGSTPPVASGSTDIIKQLNDLMSVVIVEGAQEAEGPTQQDRPPEGLETPSTSSTAAASAVSLQSQGSNAAVQGSSCPSLNSSWRSSVRSQAPTDTAVQGSPCPSFVSSRRSSLRSQAPTDTAIQGSPCPSLASSRSSRVSLVRAIRGSPCPSLASADSEDSPQRNPRYNPYYWLRPMARINYRMSLKGPWQ